MAFVQLGKQLAQQVVGDKIQDVMDSLRPPDAAKILSASQDAAKQDKPAVPAPGESLGSIIVGQIQAMQRACKEDQELIVLCTAGMETLRVLEVYAPTWQLLVLTGIDAGRNVTRLISPVESVQVVCKVMSVQANAKPARITFIIPKAK